MESFSIACTTCQARLRVRDDSVIGQILTCPKCGSMVLVAPAAVAPEDLKDTVEDLTVAPSQHGHETETETETEAPIPTSANDHTFEEDLLATSEASAAVEFPPALPAHDDSVLLPNADWMSSSMTQWRNRALTVIAAVTGITLALLILVMLDGGVAPDIVATPSTSNSEGSNHGDSPAPENTTPEVTPPDNQQPTAADMTEEPPLIAPADVPGDPPPAKSTASDAVSTDDAQPATVAVPAPPEPSPAEATAPPTPPEPAEETPPGLKPMPSSTDAAASPDGSRPLAETMRDFGALFTEPPTPTNAAVSEATPDPVVDETSDTNEAAPVRRPGPRSVEIDDRLRDPVAEIDFDGVPLVNFLRFMTDYSTIPITLDPDMLVWAKLSPTTAIKLKAKESTVAEVLDKALTPLGLHYRSEEEQLFITRRPRADGARRSVSFKVPDLVGEDAQQLQALGTQIMHFVAPETWSSQGGEGTIAFGPAELVVEQDETVLFEVLAFCDKLRVARGLNPRSPFDASLFRLVSRSERAAPKLAQPVSLTYLRPALLDRIIDRISATAKLHLLIDWRALAEVGWSPDAELTFSVVNQPVGDALNSFLQPLDLAYRVVDESTLQITSQSAVESRLEVEFYPLTAAENGNGLALLKRAQQTLGEEQFREFGGRGQLAYDDIGHCLIALLSQPQQIQLQAWLVESRNATNASATTPTAETRGASVPSE